jgi:hypothetical protein
VETDQRWKKLNCECVESWKRAMMEKGEWQKRAIDGRK